MKRYWGIALAGAMVMVLGVAWESQAGEGARVRCRIRSNRVRIQVDGRRLNPGTYTAQVVNLTASKIASTEPGKEATATAAAPNVDLDFDTTAQANDLDSFIAGDFATVGDVVQAYVLDSLGLSVASAVTACGR